MTDINEPLDQLSEDAAQLIEHLRRSHAPQSVVAEASEHIQKALEVLAPCLQHGEGWSTISIASDTPGVVWRDDDLTACMPYSPVSGRRNPIAPPVRIWRDDDHVGGAVTFSPTYAGPPDSVHGGIIAAVFDELLSMANIVTGRAGYTGTLSIRYHRKTPLETPIELWARQVTVDGRKLITRGEMRVDGEVTASAEAIFVGSQELEDVPR
jgi:acyl-coenzyme A thioesterase PaaI-like protein